MTTALVKVAEKAKEETKLRFTSLAHLLTPEFLQESWQMLNKRGAAGVDGETIRQYEVNLEANVSELYARLRAGQYKAPPVRRVEIPKGEGKVRMLGISTVSDRIAQTVVKLYLEPEVEPLFHPGSYGYRPNKSALDAVAKARERCWRNDWVLELDIVAFFDRLDHKLVMEMVNKHTSCKWILLYIERWLKAPLQLKDGALVERNCGSPQGSVISPLISNIFMHHVFDMWMQNDVRNIPFERYADDAIAHCRSEKQASMYEI